MLGGGKKTRINDNFGVSIPEESGGGGSMRKENNVGIRDEREKYGMCGFHFHFNNNNNIVERERVKV